MDLKVAEKEYEELAWKAGTLEYMEKFLESLTERERKEYTAGNLAYVLIDIIERNRREHE
nr:MAG TPA: hypothetical protein [Caudoviricetes sp.]